MSRRVLARWLLTALVLLTLTDLTGEVGGVGNERFANAATMAGPGDAYLALGDSVAAGIGASRPSERGYAAILGGYLDSLSGSPLQRIDLAMPGATSASLVTGDQMSRALSLIAAARRDRSRISPITLTIGANDLLQAAPDTQSRTAALQGVSANLRGILSRLREATRDGTGRPNADLVVTGYYDPTESPTPVPETDGWWLRELNQTIAREAQRGGALWVDVAAVFRGHERDLTWYPSDIHPTNAGHLAIANAIWRTLHYDTTAPAIEIKRPGDGPLDNPMATVMARVTDRVGVTDVTLGIDSESPTSVPFIPAIDAYATLWDGRTAAAGRHDLTLVARDAAGNQSSTSIVVEVSGVPGASPVVSLRNGAVSTPVETAARELFVGVRIVR